MYKFYHHATSLPLVIVSAFLIFLTSCNDQENIELLEGQWQLVNVSCECVPSDLNKGQHTWTFDVENNSLTVFNEVEKPLQILDSDTYTIGITASTIRINSVTYDYYFEDGNLFLGDEPDLDGPLLRFVR